LAGAVEYWPRGVNRAAFFFFGTDGGVLVLLPFGGPGFLLTLR